MGSVYARRKKLWVRFKGPDGKWTQSATEFHLGEEDKAQDLLSKLEDRVTAEKEYGAPATGPLTVALFADRWIQDRKATVGDWKGDASRLKHHVKPVIGSMRLSEVRARHVADLVRRLRSSEGVAPKTVWNIYGTLSGMFRDAEIAGLVARSPCILTKHQLGEKVDQDPEWRSGAIYTRAELEAIISDSRVAADRRVLYALQGIGGLRHGEAAGLRWKHYDGDVEPLGRLTIVRSYDKARTKTKVPRYVPVHPTLAAMLAEWKRAGWPSVFGREPTPEDLVVPMPGTARGEPGRMRTPQGSLKRFHQDLSVLGLRLRRAHDLRRTMISLARSDGANKDILRRATHKPPKEVLEGYTTFEWDVLCREVEKLKVQRAERGQIVRLAASAPSANPADSKEAPKDFATRLATRSRIPLLPQPLQQRGVWDLKTSGAVSPTGRRDTHFAQIRRPGVHLGPYSRFAGVPTISRRSPSNLEAFWRRFFGRVNGC